MRSKGTLSLMYDYENISNRSVKAALRLAKETMDSGWARRGYPPVLLKRGNVPWGLSSQQERSWNFYLHSWDMMDALLKSHSETGKVAYLTPAVEVALDWLEYERSGAEVISPFAWYDMAVGLRAYRLAYLIDAGSEAGLFSERQALELWTLLETHQQYLSDDENIVFHNNHGFYQAAGQLAMGRRFASRSEVMEQALSQGQARLRALLRTQFGDDAVHLEHSPDYHRMVYFTLRGLIDAGLIEDPEVLDFSDKIEEALSWFVLPNGKLANFGDSDSRTIASSTTEVEQKWKTSAMRYVASGGAVGAPPEASLAVFPSGGYFVVRKPAKPLPDTLVKQSYLAQQAAFHSRTHKHADTLSFIWHDRGQDILVDSGRYGYLGKAEQGSDLWLDGHWYSDPNRVYCESTRAHNVLEFDGKNYPRKGIKPYGSAIGRHLEHESGVFMLETEARHFRGVRHARVLFFLPGQWLLVYDWFKNNSGQKHDVRQWFHLSPELELEQLAQGYLIDVPGSEKPLRIQSLLSAPEPLPGQRGQCEPVMQGWWSGKEREMRPSDAFGYRLANTESGAFATLFSFSDHLSCNRSYSRVSASGRKGSFAWKDSDFLHTLRFARSSEGEMSLMYDCKPPNFLSKLKLARFPRSPF